MPAQTGLYSWSNGKADKQDAAVAQDIFVYIPIEDGVKAKDVDFKLTKKVLRIGLKGQTPIIDDQLWREIDDEESDWTIDTSPEGKRCIALTMLKKSKWDKWDYLVKCEDDGGSTVKTKFDACLKASTMPEDYEMPAKGSTHLGKRKGGIMMAMDDWRAKLSSNQFMVARLQASEPPNDLKFPQGFDDLMEDGVYHCACCAVAGEETPLYTSKMKFDSGKGWPGFFTNVKDAVFEQKDRDGRRSQILCTRCDGHLGHVFRGENWGERFRFISTDERHCVNSMSLVFTPAGGGSVIVPDYTGPVDGWVSGADIDAAECDGPFGGKSGYKNS